MAEPSDMTGRKSPTAVLREGPRTLSEEQVREIEESDLGGVLRVDIDDVIEYVHKDLKSLPDFTTLYRKYLKQRWDVYDLDFSQDVIDWTEKMTEDERQSFIAVASGFHHGERQVEIELPVFMIGASEECKLHIAAQIEDEARHTVFFDRFYREVVGLRGDDIMDILDASFPWVSETFVGPFGLLAYQADEVRRNPYDERARVRYGTNYFLWIEGVLALSVMKVTLSYARWRGFLPAYYTGFTATCRDESRHVQGGMRYLQDAVRDALDAGPAYLFVQWSGGTVTDCWIIGPDDPLDATYVFGMDYRGWKALHEGYDAQRTVMYRKILLEAGDLLEFFKAIYFFVECLAVIGAVPAGYPALAAD